MKKILSLLILLSCFLQILISQNNVLNFRHFGVDDGMTQNSAKYILQDSQGFVWIATEIGLNRYDGYTFKKFQYNPTDSNSLSSNYLMALFESSDKKIWIGTDGGGLNYYDPLTEKITRVVLDTGENPRNKYISCICEDRDKNIWAGTANGIFVYNPKSKKTIHYQHQDNPDDQHLSFFVIKDMVCDKEGNIWISPSGHGLDIYDNVSKKIKHYQSVENDDASISSNIIAQFKLDQEDNVWVCHRFGKIDKYNYITKTFERFDLNNNVTDQSKPLEFAAFLPINDNKILICTDERGLWDYNPSTKEIKISQRNPAHKNSLSSNSLAYLMLDNADVLWVGSQFNGVNLLDLHAKPFNIYSSFNIHESFTSLGPIIQDKQDEIWIGTINGLYKYNPYTKKTIVFKSDDTNPNSIPDNFVTVLLEDSRGDIWVATDQGLSIYNRKTSSFENFEPKENKSYFQGLSYWSLFEDSRANIWIGTWTDGMYCFNLNDCSLKHFRQNISDTNSLPSDNIIYFAEDKDKNIWIGTWEGGLCMYNPAKQQFTNYINQNDDSASLSHNIAMCIKEDLKGNLWIGTFGGGLNRFDKKNKEFTHFTKKNGLPSDVVMDMALDDRNNLWVTTSHGISKFNTETFAIQNFDVTDGLQSNEFSQHGAFKCSDGKILITGINGFNYFHPDSIAINPYKPKIVLTNFKIFNKPVKEYKPSLIQQPIELVKDIELTWKESIITFEFAALHYAMPSKIEYAYRLKNLEEEWNMVGDKRFATYTNLSHGTYYFQVKACNNDGIWNEDYTEIKLTITPPFWKTNTFYISSALFLILLAFSIMRYREYKLKRDKKVLEQKVLERTEEIRQQNTIILEKNEELQQQKEEIQSQRDQIEVQNNHLEGLNKELTHQKEEIETQRDEIQTQRDEIQKKNKNITDSIRYALRIQQSILPDKRTINKLLPNSFVLYLPKDIVSGDFYWIAEKQGKILFSAIDCTGHGVPGAFMSIVGYNLLKRAVNELSITKPSEILNFLSQGINLQLRQRQEESNVVKDGMDLALCAYDPKTMILEYSGVNNPLYLLRNGEIERFKGQRHPIGEAFTQKFLSYENTEIQLQKEDLVYIFSDGYVDQFGGPNRKKFMSKQFKEKLLEIHTLPMEKQKDMLNEAYQKWKGEHTQIDDVLVMGVRID